MIVLLLGKLKDDTSVPILIALLEDEEVRLQAICALGEYKRESFRCYFERFKDDTHPGWRKYARAALKKLDNAIGYEDCQVHCEKKLKKFRADSRQYYRYIN